MLQNTQKRFQRPKKMRKTAKFHGFFKVNPLKNQSIMRFRLFRALSRQILLFFLLAAPAFAAPDEAEVFGLAQELQSLRAQEVVELVKEKRLSSGEEKKPVMLFVYASWCPHCRTSMKDLASLDKAGAFKNIAPVYLSVDRDFIKLSRYLLDKEYTYFTPYVLKAAGLASPMQVLSSNLGTSWRGSIPYFAFIDTNGRLADEAFGVIPEEQLAARLRELK
jgi:thiol-disulfide isomerase/thioredoxin